MNKETEWNRDEFNAMKYMDEVELDTDRNNLLTHTAFNAVDHFE